MKKNIMLMVLSTLSLRDDKSEIEKYIYYGNQTKRYDLEGYMTNVAPTKGVIEKLADQGERLDEIVMLCSKKVQTALVWNEEKRGSVEASKFPWLKEIVSDFGKTGDKMTHQEYYEAVINKYAFQVSRDYEKNPIKFKAISISDLPSSEEIATASVEAVKQVMEDGEGINLYLVFNGGQRHVALMLLNVSKLMEIREAKIEEILIMDFDNKKKIKDFRGTSEETNVVPIQTMNAVFDSVDLVSGINEYINYGRTKMLNKYFGNCKDEEIKKILKLMEEFSNDMQLCRTQKVLDQREKLKKELENYLKEPEATEEKSKQSDATFKVLFSYVAEDILKGYGRLLDGDIPEIVQWCVEKDFIQQALTFYTEKMPKYFWEQGIFNPTETEEKEFNQFLEDCKEKKEKKGEKDWMVRVYDSGHYANDERCYSWMTSYLPNSSEWLKNISKTEREKRMEYAEKTLWLKHGHYIKMENIKKFPEPPTMFSKLWNKKVNYAVRWLKHLTTGRVTSKLIENDYEELKEIMTSYLLIKEQRNGANHAADQGEKQELLSYEDTRAFLKEAATTLQDIAKEGVTK